jgi:predicted TIM-barrel fold metal-dependent hydrolase
LSVPEIRLVEFEGERGGREKYIRAFGAERMAFGSDYPLWNPVVETERFLKLNLTGEQFEQIAHKTAQRILGL